MEMTLVKFLLHVGLLTDADNKVAQVKQLNEKDREWFAERALVEYGITITRPKLIHEM